MGVLPLSTILSTGRVERGLAYDKKGFFNNYVNSDYNTFNNIQLEKAPYYNFVIRVLTWKNTIWGNT